MYISSTWARSACAWGLFFGVASCEMKDDALPAAAPAFAPNFTLAKTNSELKAVQDDPTANIVRSRQDLDALLRANKSPLLKLPAADREAFINGLVFRPGIGVVGFDYAAAESKLSYDDFAQVVAVFGLDAKQGYWGFSQDPAIKWQLAAGGSRPLPRTEGVTTNRGDDQSTLDSDEYYDYISFPLR